MVKLELGLAIYLFFWTMVLHIAGAPGKNLPLPKCIGTCSANLL